MKTSYDINTPEGLIAGWLEYMSAICDEVHDSGEIDSDQHLYLKGSLEEIRNDVECGNSANAVMNTNIFWGYLHVLQIPSLEKAALSSSGRNAATERQNKRWTPDKKAALLREYEKEKNNFSSPRKLYEELANRILGSKTKYRQIKGQIEKITKTD